MRFSVRGAASLEMPLRILNLMEQQGAVLEHVTLQRVEDDYLLLIDMLEAPPGRIEAILYKIRAMVLVLSVELDPAACPAHGAHARAVAMVG